MGAFFGKAIRDNKENPERMRRDILSILDHYSSTPENPRHDNCPTGPDSHCSYNRDIATGRSEHVPVKDPIGEALREVLLPIFERLTDPGLLDACKMGYTQNPNESFHHVLWGLAPKEQYTSPQETELALCLAVGLFNDGIQATMSNLH